MNVIIRMPWGVQRSFAERSERGRFLREELISGRNPYPGPCVLYTAGTTVVTGVSVCSHIVFHNSKQNAPAAGSSGQQE